MSYVVRNNGKNLRSKENEVRNRTQNTVASVLEITFTASTVYNTSQTRYVANESHERELIPNNEPCMYLMAISIQHTSTSIAYLVVI